ncbi:unnamed protein product [Rhizoctonia solani]|uniref:Fungal-type protein kinase domain-containing protein n=1 Tax=Rhizoctonia solani TaxID=456999 RepID=A0A8H2WGL4_9AGAM|nr:unnamed protein product [Rhizoctonia solani]
MKLSEGNRSTGAPPVAYDITVRQSDKIKKVYRTVEILSDIGAESLIGRGTRVWKVQELDDNGERFGPFYALKDVWVHDDRPMEHDTLAEIKKQQPSYERHFLTVLCAGFATVKIGDSSRPDNTKGTIRRGHDFSLTNQVLRPRATITENQDNSRKRKAPSTSGTAYEFIQYTPTARREDRWNHGYLSRTSRQHYRIVFKEVGVPVHRLRNYQDIITAITGGSEGLYAIHLTNQIHRDISSGNIMLVQEDGKEARGVIIDLEYIQRLDSTIDSHGAKKGTYEFIAVEVAAEEYLSEAEPEESLDTQTTPRIVRPFRQNPLHDLESVWWLCIWVLFRTVRADEHPTNRYLHNYLKAFGSQGDRYVFWNNGPLFKRYTAHFSEPVFSRAMRYWCNKLKEVYEESYMENEFVEIPISFLHKARSAQREALDALSEVTKNYHSELRNLWELMPLPDTPETQSENGNNDSGSKLRAPEGPELKKQRNANNVD